MISLELDPRRYDASDTPAPPGAAKIPHRALPDENCQLEPRPIFYRPVGCEACVGTGYYGRSGIYELLMVDEPVRHEILSNSDSKHIARVANERGMTTLRQDGTRQVIEGVTSIEEVLAATQAGDLKVE